MDHTECKYDWLSQLYQLVNNISESMKKAEGLKRFAANNPSAAKEWEREFLKSDYMVQRKQKMTSLFPR